MIFDDYWKIIPDKASPLLRPMDSPAGLSETGHSFQHEAEKQRSRLIIEQTQEDEEKGIGLFDFPLEVAVENVNGEWSRYSIQVDGKRQVLSWTSDTRAQQIIIDPNMRVLFQMKFQPGLDMSQRSLEKAPTVAGRLQAIQALGRDGSRAAIDLGRGVCSRIQMGIAKRNGSRIGECEYLRGGRGSRTIIGLGKRSQSHVQPLQRRRSIS